MVQPSVDAPATLPSRQSRLPIAIWAILIGATALRVALSGGRMSEHASAARPLADLCHSIQFPNSSARELSPYPTLRPEKRESDAYADVADQLSKRLGNLAQARGAIGIKPASARRLLDHPIGRNEHGDRVGGGVILGQPRQRTMWTAAKALHSLVQQR
jgi:hypothetical protein